jgi:hypothetical protein
MILKTLALFFVAFIITACGSSNAYVRTAGSAKVKSTKRIVGYETVTKTKVVPPAPPVRIEPYPGTWDGEAAIDYARRNAIHGAMFKPCYTNPGGEMCLSKEPWKKTPDDLRQFFKDEEVRSGKKSPYCGAVWVQGTEAAIPYGERVPIEEEVAETGEGGGGVEIKQETKNQLVFAPKLELNGYADSGYRSSRYSSAPYPRSRGSLSLLRPRTPRPRVDCPPRIQNERPHRCPSCGGSHSGPCPRMSQPRGRASSQEEIIRIRNRNIARNTTILNAPRYFRPPSSSSRSPSRSSSTERRVGPAFRGIEGVRPGVRSTRK